MPRSVLLKKTGSILGRIRVELILNGNRVEVDPGLSVAALLESMWGTAAREEGIAVAVNDAVVPRDSWAEKRLEEGDRVEVIRAVQGG